MPDLLRALRAFLYPFVCPACGRSSPADLLCSSCAEQVRGASPSAERPPGIDALVAPYRYEGVVRDLLIRFKYGSDRHPLSALSALLRAAVDPAYLLRPDAVVPVPMSFWRSRRRGFNQAELLGRAVADELRIPLLPSALRRARRRPPQASLDRAARLVNLQGGFRPGDGLFGRAVLLVDDVVTTGATLAEAARAARAGGARRVSALVLARAEA